MAKRKIIFLECPECGKRTADPEAFFFKEVTFKKKMCEEEKNKLDGQIKQRLKDRHDVYVDLGEEMT